MKGDKKEPIINFATSKAWNAWLAKHHAKSGGIWVRMYKKASGVKSINYDEALDEALCYGWIDSQKKSYDEKSWVQKFAPRRAKSKWSKRNREHITRLIKEKRTRPAGLKEVEAAKRDGRWKSAYDSPKNIVIPADFLKALKKDKKAYAFFLMLNKTNGYAIGWRLQTAKKPETRAKRMGAILEMMRKKEKFH